MVRVFLKGGVWKNSEDEILKAAVQKYGKQQWARVASLLNRKTAKQAKARWYEWLDPSIRKTEWSAAEEEKLLHLAKLMPAQWKTIASTIGRTATQCQEHYEYLLDQAATQNAGGEDATDQLRAATTSALRAGQIDSHPETKPARPDPIDMDEDEMEMLQEARARLANTQGKKAKRKQRERLLAQAKRLADLQKRRELKQAGLLSKAASKKSKKSKREIDLGVEIPFHKPAPAGFHDVSNEDERAERMRQKRLKQVNFQKVNEQQYRTRDREAAQMRKKEESRLRILEDSNEKYAKQQKEDKEELPARSFARGPLQLPEPTVTDSELTQLAKLQQQAAMSSTDVAGGTEATKALLGDYTDRPLPTPMRTPAAGGDTTSRQQTLLREASQLRQLERGQTPLLIKPGLMQEEEVEEDDEEDRKPAAKAPPHRSADNRTPAGPRDQFGLNKGGSALLPAKRPGTYQQDDAVSIGASTFASQYTIRELARQERRAKKRARQELEAALAALPAPQYEYELAAPEDMDVDDDEEKKVETVVEDRADLEAKEQERLRMEAEKLYEARNSVIKRSELPRPSHSTNALASLENISSEEQHAAAKTLILEEMKMLIQHDAHAFPVSNNDMSSSIKKKSKKKKRKQTDANDEVSSNSNLPKKVSLEPLAEDNLNNAKSLIEEELSTIFDEKVASVVNMGKASNRDDALKFLAKENTQTATEQASKLVYSAEKGWFEARSEKDQLESLRIEFETLQEATAAMKKKNDKVESKLRVMTAGYCKRADKFVVDIQEGMADLSNAHIEQAIYERLQSQETVGGNARIAKLQEEVATLKGMEADMQRRYGELLVEKRRLVVSGRSLQAGA